MPLLAVLRGRAWLALALVAAIAAARPVMAAGSEGEIVDYAAMELAGKGPISPDEVGNEQRFVPLQPVQSANTGFALIGGGAGGSGATASISGTSRSRSREKAGARSERPPRIAIIEYGVVRVPGRQTVKQGEASPPGGSPAPAVQAPAGEAVKTR